MLTASVLARSWRSLVSTKTPWFGCAAFGYSVVNVSALEANFEAGATVDAAGLNAAGLIPNVQQPVKILGDGEISKKLVVKADWYSKSAIEKLTKAGGEVLNAKGEKFELPKPKKKFVKNGEGNKQPAEAK